MDSSKASGFGVRETTVTLFYVDGTKRARSRGLSGPSLTLGASVCCWPRRSFRIAGSSLDSGSWTSSDAPNASAHGSEKLFSQARAEREAGPLQPSPTSLVLPATAALQQSVWNEFVRWVDAGSGHESSACTVALPVLLVELLCAYGQVLYSGGKPLQHYRQLLALAQRKVPGVRPHIRQAWEMLTRWERLEPTKHRPPMPEAILEAMCSLALAWGWTRWVVVTLLGFYGCCRIGEVLKALRQDLFTPGDLLRSTRFALQFNEPKTRTRGARVQHTTIIFKKDVADFLVEACGQLPRSSRLFYGRYEVGPEHPNPDFHTPCWVRLTAVCLAGSKNFCKDRPDQPVDRHVTAGLGAVPSGVRDPN